MEVGGPQIKEKIFLVPERATGGRFLFGLSHRLRKTHLLFFPLFLSPSSLARRALTFHSSPSSLILSFSSFSSQLPFFAGKPNCLPLRHISPLSGGSSGD